MDYQREQDICNWYQTPAEMQFTESGFPIMLPFGELPTCLNVRGFDSRSRAAPGEFLHFYLDDYKFNCVWNSPSKYLGVLANGCFQPDFSLYIDMPLPMQKWQHYRKQWLGAYWQLKGVPVIPTICWADFRSYDFCFDGVPKNAVVSVSTLGCWEDKLSRAIFLEGYKEMFRRLDPSIILVHGTEEIALEGNIYVAKKLDKPFNKARDLEGYYGWQTHDK